MSRRLLIVLLFTTFCLFSEVSAQLFGEQPEFESKWVFGGGLGLGFSQYGFEHTDFTTNWLYVKPQVGAWHEAHLQLFQL